VADLAFEARRGQVGQRPELEATAASKIYSIKKMPKKAKKRPKRGHFGFQE